MTDREGDAGMPAQPQRDWTLQSLFDDLELALYGKSGNTWEWHQADRVYVFLAKLKVEFNAERIAKEAAEKRGRDTKPCSHCQWPKPMDDNYNICPCCGFEPGYDDSLVGPYQWDGTWWAKDERKPELVRRLEARCAALQAQLAVPPAVDGPDSTMLPDDRVRDFWRSVQGPYAELTGPLIRFAGLLFRSGREQGASDLSWVSAQRDVAEAKTASIYHDQPCAACGIKRAAHSGMAHAFILGGEATQPPRDPLDQGCRIPPAGWWCSREPGHGGPCAARPRSDYPAAPGPAR